MISTLLLATLGSAYAAPVQLKTADGTSLRADVKGSGKHAVVLVHGNQSDSASWGDVATLISRQKVMVVNLDLRGHGASKGEAKPEAMQQDVLAAVDFAVKRGASQVTLMGMGLGGNLSFNVAGQREVVTDVAMISPMLDIEGVKLSRALPSYGDRPLLMIAGVDDQLSLKAATLVGDRLEKATIEVLRSEGRGQKLLNRDADLRPILIRWITGDYDDAPRGVTNVETKQGDDLQTTGKKLGEKD